MPQVEMTVWTLGVLVGAALALGAGTTLYVIDGVRRLLRRRRRARAKILVPAPRSRRGGRLELVPRQRRGVA